MSVERVNPGELIRPHGYSHAVIAQGRLVCLAGQTATGDTGSIVAGGIVEQFEQALANLLMALRAAGGGPNQLASVTVYLVDIDDYRAHSSEIGSVWRRLVGTDYPAMAAVGVARLWDPAARVELQGFAVT
ncbi:MAG: RidA family protein [Nocardioidaceae bacterium]